MRFNLGRWSRVLYSPHNSGRVLAFLAALRLGERLIVAASRHLVGSRSKASLSLRYLFAEPHQPLVNFGIALAQWRDEPEKLGFALTNIVVDFLPVAQVERNCSVHLLQHQARKVLL